MPELAEVEYFRSRWNDGLGHRIARVALHGEKRIFRGVDCGALQRMLAGATLQRSEARGKQMVFIFSKGGWLGVHLGMTGDLRVEPPAFQPAKHDHLVLYQAKRALVFKDARLFGRIRFHVGKNPPPWWSEAPPAVTSPEFSQRYLAEHLRRRKAPVKAVLLSQSLFPGVGNWMADEILWQARVHPARLSADLKSSEMAAIWRASRHICRVAMKTIGVDWGDPPEDWLIHVRWKRSGVCPRDGEKLQRATIGGRTTAWCARCQGGSSAKFKERSHQHYAAPDGLERRTRRKKG